MAGWPSDHLRPSGTVKVQVLPSGLVVHFSAKPSETWLSLSYSTSDSYCWRRMLIELAKMVVKGLKLSISETIALWQ